MHATTLILIGSILLAAYGVHAVGRRMHVPRVTLLLILGVVVGPSGLDLIPPVAETTFSLVTHLALAMVGFLLGERLAFRELQSSRRIVLGVSIGVSLVTAGLVFLAVWVMTGSVVVGLILAGIAPATAPAATIDVVREQRAKGPLTDMLLRVVALDDAWSLILFTLAVVTAAGLGGGQPPLVQLGAAAWEIVGSVALGTILGTPMAWATGRVKPGEPTLLEAAGFVFLAAGLAVLTGLSYLLTCMSVGATVANLARHHTRPFRDIGGIADPFLAIFFVLAGYELDVTAVSAAGLLMAIYLSARLTGRVIGGNWSARAFGAGRDVSRRIGWCLLPQAGVAMGLALAAAQRLPETREVVLPLVIATTVVFELVGPVLTSYQLRAAGEIP